MDINGKTELIKSLVKAQAAVGTARRDGRNDYFRRTDGTASRYATLESVYDACRDAMAQNGLCVIQRVTYDYREGRTVPTMYLHTILAHESGESMDGGSYPIIIPEPESKPEANDKRGRSKLRQDHHAIGSAITYARRYSLMSLLGIATEDDDGNMACKFSIPESTRVGAAKWAVKQGAFANVNEAMIAIQEMMRGNKYMDTDEFRAEWMQRFGREASNIDNKGNGAMDRVTEQLNAQ